jgi:uncharacterized membrane protein
MNNLVAQFSPFFSSFTVLIPCINLILHILFASAVAKDAGNLSKINRTPYLVSGVTWAFATLLGGVFVAGLYWLIHYSTLARGKSL